MKQRVSFHDALGISPYMAAACLVASCTQLLNAAENIVKSRPLSLTVETMDGRSALCANTQLGLYGDEGRPMLRSIVWSQQRKHLRGEDGRDTLCSTRIIACVQQSYFIQLKHRVLLEEQNLPLGRRRIVLP
jgi:hypothetical protein